MLQFSLRSSEDDTVVDMNENDSSKSGQRQCQT